MRKEKNVKNRAMRRKMLKKSGKKLLAAALSAAMLSMGIYPAGFPVNVSAEEAVAQVADAVAYKAKVDISKLSPINGVITYDITEDGNYYFEGSNNFNESYIPTSIIVAPGVKAGIYFDGVDIENYDGEIAGCGGSMYIEGTTPVYISEYAQVSLHTLNKSTIKLADNASAIVVSKNAYCEINDDLELDVETDCYSTGIDVAGTFEMNGGILYIEGDGGSVGIGVCDIYATEDYSDSNIIINDGTLDIYTVNAPAIGVYAGYESSADKKYNFGNIEIHGGQIVANTTGGVSTIGVRDYDYSKVYSECNGIIIDGGNLTLEQNIWRGDGNKPAVYPGKEVTDGAVVIAGGNIYNTVSDRYDESLSSEIKIKDRFGGNDVSRKVLTLSEQTEREIINITSCDADGNSYYYGNNDMKTDKEGKLYTYLSDGMTTVQVALSDRSIMEGTVSGDAAELSLIEDKSNVPVFSKSHYSFNYNDELTIDTPTVGADCDISYSYAEKKTPDAAPQDNTQWTKLSSLSDVKSLKTGAYWLKASSSDAQAGGVTYRAADTIVSVNVKSCSNHMCDNWVVNEENDAVETAVCSICGETVYRTHDYSDKTGVCKNCKYKCRHTSLKYEYQTEKSHEIVCRACGYSESVEHNWQENLGTVKEAGYTFAYDEESSSWISDTSCIDSSTAKTVWIFDMEQEGTVSFEWGVSSEENYDYLNVFLDEDSVYEQKIIDKKSGNESSGYITGEAVTPELTAGQHMLTAYYVKDSGTREGLDKAYIKFSSDFKYSEVKGNTNTSNSRFEYDEERQRWTCNGYQEDDDGSNSKKIGLTITCEEDCKLPFHIGLPQCGEVYMSSNSLERYLNSSDEMLWINFNKGNNNLFFEWYWESEDAEAASNEAFYIEYIPAASHICVDCGYLDDHEYSSECDEDCNICGQLRTPSETHKYSSDCDTVCNDCGYQRKVQTEHQFGTDGQG